MSQKVDLDYLKSMADGDDAMFNEMVNLFKEQVPELIENMEKYLKEQNYSKLKGIAHQAKSSVAIMGMHNLSKQMKEFEQLLEANQQPEKYQEYVDTFISEAKEALAELAELNL